VTYTTRSVLMLPNTKTLPLTAGEWYVRPALLSMREMTEEPPFAMMPAT
jgi:hypothetical protein